MVTEVRAGSLALAAFLIVVLAVCGFLAFENRRMKDVLIEHTLLELERDYEEAQRAEEANLGLLKASLEEALNGLTALRGLSAEETALVERAMWFTDAILRATTSEGISLE